ncbi:MAG: alpha/beta fold hydrolase [Anaerolineales bacterium]|nr:alpha/beta fold hydrolase [Anaerolineales bacterium]
MNNKTKPDWLDEKEYPFESHYFTTPQGNMHYVDEGSGDPVIFVPGNPSWSFEAREMIKSLSGNYRCIAVDHIGFGLSDKPFDYSYLPQEQAKNLEALLESLDLKNITMVVGDWGGPIGLSYAIRRPEKIKSIVITNTWLWSVKDDWYYVGYSSFVGGPIGRWLIRTKNFFAQTVVRMAFGDKSKLTPHIHKHYLNQFPNPEDRKGNWVFPAQVVGASDWLKSLWNQRDALKDKVKIIAWGAKDIAFREKELQTWIRAFPKARVIRFPNSGHFIPEENPVELAEAIRDID